MKPSRRQFLFLLTGFLVGCNPAGTEPDYTVLIQQTMGFEPASLTIPRGSIVAWQNRADNIYTVTADPSKSQHPERILLPAGVDAFDSGDLYPGDRWHYTFETAGDYVYFSRYHEADEMRAMIRVTA